MTEQSGRRLAVCKQGEKWYHALATIDPDGTITYTNLDGPIGKNVEIAFEAALQVAMRPGLIEIYSDSKGDIESFLIPREAAKPEWQATLD